MRRVTVAVALCSLAVFGCTGVALAYEAAEVVNGATITGRIAFKGAPPAPRVFEVEKDPEVCGKERALVEVAVHNGSLKGAVIVLEGVTKGKPFAAQSFSGDPPGEGEFRYAGGKELSLEIRSKICDFGPFTGVLTPHKPVRVVNEDPVKHTLHTYVVLGRKGHILSTVHNLHINANTEIKRSFPTRLLEKSRVVSIVCDRHEFMQNWLYVVKTSYFSVSDQDGNFTIDRVPPGRYELVAWHPVLGLKKQEVTVAADGKVDVSFVF